MSAESIQFTVHSHCYSKTAEKGPIFKVKLKNRSDDHALSLVSDSRSVYEGYPIDGTVEVKIGKAQRILDELLNEEG